MSRPLVFHIEVPEDVEAAYNWYESQRLGLGNEFLTELFDCLEEIANNEQRFGIIERDIRAGLLSRFPYVVYYRPKKDQIDVLAVHLGRRHPKSWHRRTIQ